MKIALYISELLQNNQTLVLSGLGRFSVSHQAASYNETTNKYNPPVSNISFDSNIKYQDEILLNFIVQKENVSVKEATEKLNNFIYEIKFKLQNNEEVKLDGIGVLFTNDKNEILFKQENQNNLASDSFGLQEIELSTISKPTINKSISNTSSAKNLIRNKAEKGKLTDKSKNTRKIIITISTSAAALLILSYFIFFTSNFDNSISKIFVKKNSKSLTVNKQNIQPNVIPDSIIKNDTIKEKINSSLNSTTNKKAALFYKEESKEKSSKNIYNKFYIIAGSFKLERNAKKFAAELEKKGYSAEVIYFNNNLYRISIDVFNNESEALKELYKIRAKNNLKSVWLYKTS